MTTENIKLNPEDLHRGVKLAMDSGEAADAAEAEAIFKGYRLVVEVGNEVQHSAAHQAAVLSLVNTGRRALLGGIYVRGSLDAKLVVPSLFGGTTLREAIVATGGKVDEPAPPLAPVVLVGLTTPSDAAPVVLRLTFDAWAGGVAPPEDRIVLREKPDDVLGAVLASAIALSEVFQWLRERGRAANRVCGLSAWMLDADWTKDHDAPDVSLVPDNVWVLGLGHLGQAFLWTLSLLIGSQLDKLKVVLHDYDAIAKANDSTSLLTTPHLVGTLKTRAVAGSLERHGVKTRLIERKFNGRERIRDDEPRVLFCGVDNSATRSVIDQAGFDLVVEAGLGNGWTDYLSLRLHTFPASRMATVIWSGDDEKDAPVDARAYKNLERHGMDQCGLLQIATRSVGVPFVGLVAACLSLGEMIRTLMGQIRYDVIDLSLRDPTIVDAVQVPTNNIGNLGYLERDAGR
jgi:hypothetical protein